MPGNEGAAADLERINRAGSMNEQMMISGCDVGVARHDRIAISGFTHCNLATVVEAPRKSRSKALGHVLHCDNAGTVCRHLCKEVQQCFGASGRSSNGDDSVCLLADRGTKDWGFC